MILTKKGASYADLLRSVKQTVKPGTEAAKAILTIRESREGNMVIVLSKEAQPLKEHLRKELNSITGVKVRDGRQRDQVMVTIDGFDRETSKAEVADALKKEFHFTEGECTMGQARQSYAGNRAVSVKIPKRALADLEARGGIKVGLSWCSVKERVEVERCYKWWQYGHKGRECTAPEDVSDKCGRCGSSGHVKRDCREERCLTCKVPGHVAGSGRCPEFRKALSRARAKMKKRRAY